MSSMSDLSLLPSTNSEIGEPFSQMKLVIVYLGKNKQETWNVELLQVDAVLNSIERLELVAV